MIFDLFPRDLTVIKGAEACYVEYLRAHVAASAPSTDLLPDPQGLKLDLQHRVTPVDMYRYTPSINTGQATLAVVEVTQPRPYPLVASGIPPTHIEADGSYEFTPVVAGGLGPYSFILEGTLPTGFTFNASTGTLSRQPA